MTDQEYGFLDDLFNGALVDQKQIIKLELETPTIIRFDDEFTHKILDEQIKFFLETVGDFCPLSKDCALNYVKANINRLIKEKLRKKKKISRNKH